MLVTINGEQWLIVKQPYLEGMFSYEYAVILRAMKQLEIPQVNVYLEATSVTDSSLNNNIHRIKHYYNKRFYKYTEEDFHDDNDIESHLNVPQD